MAILVTGATGHLGPHLIAELLRAGDFDRLYVVARHGTEPAALRVKAVERIAREHLAQQGVTRVSASIVPLCAGDDVSGIVRDITVIVHAAADTRFAADPELLRGANVEATAAVCGLAERCPRLRQLLHVSTACVAGRRTGHIPETIDDDRAGFANAYEQTKWQAEQVVVSSGLPARIARLSTCAGRHVTGYVHRFGALHHLLHWMSRGLVPMVPGSADTLIDIVSTDVAAAWLARAAATDVAATEICHVALGDGGIPLATLLDVIIALVGGGGRGRVQRPLVVDETVFRSFNDMVRRSGDAL